MQLTPQCGLLTRPVRRALEVLLASVTGDMTRVVGLVESDAQRVGGVHMCSCVYVCSLRLDLVP